MTPVCSVQPRNYTERKSGQERSAGRPGPQRVECNRGETNDLSGSVAIVAAAGRDVPRSVPVRRGCYEKPKCYYWILPVILRYWVLRAGKFQIPNCESQR